MDLPPFIQNENYADYQEELNQTLRDNLSNNGYPLPSVTDAQLTTDLVLNPSTGQMTTLSTLMPDGTIWFVNDSTPPTAVIKISGALYKFSTTAYP